jgi:sulfonate transport system substrate-binding protein
MMTRRHILATTLLLATALATPAHAEDKPAEIRIGTQKGGFFPAVRQRQTLENAFKPLGIEIKWIDFQFGPPLLEAINVGSVDFGYVGDAPPIFAQAGNAKIRYVAAVKSDGNTQAIIVPKDSPIKTLADLKGKRIAFGKGSSAHNLLVAALEKAGLSWSDITPAPLAPADATAAFVKGSVDAWSIWDPYQSSAETTLGAKTLTDATGLVPNTQFYLSSQKFIETEPKVLDAILDELRGVDAWAKTDIHAVAEQLSPAIGLSVPVLEVALKRQSYGIKPIDDQILADQQKLADTLYQLKLIPKEVRVSDIARKPGT